jgi:GTPase SAR1 family protein
MDFLLQNLDWLLNKISAIVDKQMKNPQNSALPTHLFIFDLPGQIELYINTNTVRQIIEKVTKLITEETGTSPCILELFDCTYMHDINQFISLCMMSLSTMINMEMPHINLLNKVDVIKSAQHKPSRGLIN